jgi:hypothetical protein
LSSLRSSRLNYFIVGFEDFWINGGLEKMGEEKKGEKKRAKEK